MSNKNLKFEIRSRRACPQIKMFLAVAFVGTMFSAPIGTCAVEAQPLKKLSQQIPIEKASSGGSGAAIMPTSASKAAALQAAEIIANAKSRVAPLLPQEEASVAVYEKCNKAVVNIAPASTAEEVSLDVMPPSEEGNGSGTIISSDGYMVTNQHVVGNAEAARIVLHDGTSHIARLVGVDPDNDIAVLKMEAPKGKSFHHLEFGDSSSLKVGRQVFAIGNPFGYDRTMTAGIISSLGRTLSAPITKRSIKGVIQTDAAINPGNSGGPLLDSAGNLIGINTAILSRLGQFGQSSGVGLAIPSNKIKSILPDLIVHHKVLRPETGIVQLMQVQLHPKDLALMICQIEPRSPASQSGLLIPRVEPALVKWGEAYIKVGIRKPGDIITHADNLRVENQEDFYAYIEKMKPNQVVTLTILRDKSFVKVPVKLTVTGSN
ncbi:MAG: trypsin-like peptidase domain-containing protein [Candidatus Obscuribacterales bacterium]|nr:trypsin-like peptidase domain-containing protein [Candidatus Obscuribacterales bacterium]